MAVSVRMEEAMSYISDELRRFSDSIDGYAKAKIDQFDDDLGCISYLNSGGITKGAFTTKWFRNIADRIDAEMAELPRDRDGVPIRVDDTVYGEDGRAWHVRGVTIGEMSEDSRYTIRVTGDTGEWRHYKPEWLTHERPDSWSRIADELDEWCDRTDVDGDACGELRALASRLRRLAEREDER